ncbi:MAG: glutathione S-transferase family protein [Spongiibacteraceae bacterium]
MLTLHHLERSRGERVIWLLEELEVPYEIVLYRRDPQGSSLQKLREIHPVGKSPTLCDGDVMLVESGAILEYLLQRYGKGRLVPPVDSADFPRYLQWMHFTEGSLMAHISLDFAIAHAGAAESPIAAMFRGSTKRCLAFMNSELEKHSYLAGDEFTAADIMAMFAADTLANHVMAHSLADYPAIQRYRERIITRPTYMRAMAKANPA